MTVSQIELTAARAQKSRRLIRRLAEPAVAVLTFALLTGAWLAFFTFAPFDFTPPRIG
jgi:hypothetical protein